MGPRHRQGLGPLYTDSSLAFPFERWEACHLSCGKRGVEVMLGCLERQAEKRVEGGLQVELQLLQLLQE